MMKHFDCIEKLCKQHGLDSMDFDAENVQKLVEEIGEIIRFKEIQDRVIQINLNDDVLPSDDDITTDQFDNSQYLKMKVVKLKRDL